MPLLGYVFSSESAELAIVRFENDNVGDGIMETFVIEKCGPDTVYDNWLMDEGIGG